jgi:hypothetical protein
MFGSLMTPIASTWPLPLSIPVPRPQCPHSCSAKTRVRKLCLRLPMRVRRYRALFHLPQLRLLLDKLVHQGLALGVVKHYNLHASLPEVRLPAEERHVFANDHAGDPVQETGAGAHVAGRQCGEHCASWETHACIHAWVRVKYECFY